MLDQRVNQTIRLMSLCSDFAKTYKWSAFKAKADRIVIHLFNKEINDTFRAGEIARDLTNIETSLEVAIERMRKPAKLADANVLLATLKESIPKLISLWVNFNELKFTLSKASDKLDLIYRIAYGYRSSSSAIDKMLFKANMLMGQEKVTFKDIQAIFKLFNEVETYILLTVNDKAMFMISDFYVDFKDSLLELEVTALLECE